MDWKWIKLSRAEDPRRLRAFSNSTQELVWDDGNVVESLTQLFRAVDELAESEVGYYYRRRGTRAWISGISRLSAWLFGTIGLILPLLAVTTNPEFMEWAQYGYLFLAASASCLAANSLFGGTEGHIRFVSTQLELEKMITKARISWCQYLSLQVNDNKDSESGFLLIQDYANDLHTITISETGRWGEALLKELAKFQKTIETKKASPEK
jgi:SMODS and SLOG-associating 2TM effector domain 2